MSAAVQGRSGGERYRPPVLPRRVLPGSEQALRTADHTPTSEPAERADNSPTRGIADQASLRAAEGHVRPVRHARPGGPAGAPAQARAGALLLAGCGVAIVAATTALVVWTRLGQRADERSRWSIAVPEEMTRIVQMWLGAVSVDFIVAALVVTVALALARRRWGAAAAALVIVGGANVTTQVLKEAIPRPYFGVGPMMNSLPSGHVTVLTSVALAALLVLPRRLRPLGVFVAGAVATFTGAATILERWHRPSDVVAALGVCAIWSGLALWALSRRRPGRGRRGGAGTPLGEATGDGSVAGFRRPALRVLLHLAAGLLGAAVVGALLIAGGLVTSGTSTNVVVGAFMLTATGLCGAALAAVVGALADSCADGARPGCRAGLDGAQPPIG